MIFMRYTKPKRIEVKIHINREIFDLLEDLRNYYRIPLNDVIESLICCDHEEIRIRSTTKKNSASFDALER
jgi:hypothetical protein